MLKHRVEGDEMPSLATCKWHLPQVRFEFARGGERRL